MHNIRFSAFVAALLVAVLADAQDLSSCHEQPDPLQRLACYDRVSGYARHENERPRGILAERWGYDSNAAASRFRLSQHDVNYVALSYSDGRNTTPQSPSHPMSGGYPASLDPLELSFQLSAKTRVLDLGTNEPDHYNLQDHNFGIWLAYTQQSFWQIFNAPQSRPFRETDYQPEVIFAIRPTLLADKPTFGDVSWRVFNIGLVHQSNGQSDPLSRSWNRVYAQFGFDRSDSQGGDWAVLVRPWYRFKEDPLKDDNPDITDYLGHGDIQLLYRKGPFALTATARGNVRTGKGAGALDFTFPLWCPAASTYPLCSGASTYPFKGYVRLFSGYGESLIDYNKRQTTISVGFALSGER